jgi:hypothetical protein
VTNPGRFDARELFRALAHRDVEFVTIGGIAIQAYGGQRLTQDLDVAIAPSTDNLARLQSTIYVHSVASGTLARCLKSSPRTVAAAWSLYAHLVVDS